MCYREEKYGNEGFGAKTRYDGLETPDKNRLCQREASEYRKAREELANQRRNREYKNAKALCR